jgi:outer membrane protein OmpA-like peptidoglycan-associated protein
MPGTAVFADWIAAADTLTPIAQWLAANPPGHAWLDGTTAEVGPTSYDIKLARQRAEAVRKELITLGAKPAQITPGFGQSTTPAEFDSVSITLGGHAVCATVDSVACWGSPQP